MDIISLLEYLEEILETSSKVPMSGKVMVNKKEALDIIDQIVNYLPEEFKKAKWICEEKERILSEAIQESERVKAENLQMLKKHIENHDITKEAKLRAEEIESQAQKNAKAMRLSARDYANGILTQLEFEINDKGQAMLKSLKGEMESFVKQLESDISLKGNTIRDNINELKEFR
ncbi:MAG: ATPase [Firmicutes bacterium]|nr:ATPase [Bacillota bacterium]